MEHLGRVGLVGRFRPPHNGGAGLLRKTCELADEAIIGIGSANKDNSRYNARNPFTVEETEDMLRLVLRDFNNYKIIHVPDFGHIPGNENGFAWRDYVLEAFGDLDYFVSGNEFVRELLKDRYPILDPHKIVLPNDGKFVKGAKVRYEMAIGGDWKNLVPEEVREYLERNGLVERFRREFGEETIRVVNQGYDIDRAEGLNEEIKNVRAR